MKKILFAAVVFSAFITGCLKDKTINTDGFNKTATNMEIIPYSDNNGFTGGGLESFSKATVQTSGSAPVKLFFVVNVAGTNGTALNRDITVTTALDDAARVSYNGTSTDKYDPLPDSCYSFPIKSNTLKAGTYLDTFFVTFYPAKIDQSKNYMAAITLKDASGVPISSNFSTVYFHTIGNPLAGPYSVVGTRYNYTGVIGYTGGAIPSGYVSTVASPSPKVAAPLSPTVIQLDYANLGGSSYKYVITYNPTTQTLTDVSANSILAAAVSNFAVTLKTYNATTKQIHIISTYNNGAGGTGSDRVIDETFTHQ